VQARGKRHGKGADQDTQSAQGRRPAAAEADDDGLRVIATDRGGHRMTVLYRTIPTYLAIPTTVIYCTLLSTDKYGQ